VKATKKVLCAVLRKLLIAFYLNQMIMMSLQKVVFQIII